MKRETGDERFGNTLRGKWNFRRGCNGCYRGKRIIRSNARLGGATRDTTFLANVPARLAGSHLTTVALPSAYLLSSSPLLDPGRGTSLRAPASLPFQQHSRLNTIFASTATPSVTAATSTAITLYTIPTHPAAADVLALTPLGTSPVPPSHATRRVAPAHTPRLSVSHVLALTKHTLPSAPSVLPLSPVKRVWMMMRCTSTGGLPPTPLTCIWRLLLLLCCPQGMPCSFSGLLCPARRGWPHF